VNTETTFLCTRCRLEIDEIESPDDANANGWQWRVVAEQVVCPGCLTQDEQVNGVPLGSVAFKLKAGRELQRRRDGY
jgi:rubredoxin